MQADPWTRLVPDMFRSLADPAQRRLFPRPENAGLENACASWGALNYALCSLLGWRDVGTGLARWYRAGKPVADSPVLSFIQEVWGEDNMLEYYAAWAWKPRDSGWLVPQSVSISEGPSPHWLATNSRYWQVDVFDRQVGYLGRYRQSRETGLWFTGRHSVHMWGQP